MTFLEHFSRAPKSRHITAIMAAIFVVSAVDSVMAVPPVMSNITLTNVLSEPIFANASAYDAKDNQGNSMQCVSVIDLVGQSAKYAAVYSTPYAVTNGYTYNVNLATSDDLIHWTFIRTLATNADLPEIKTVSNGSWIILQGRRI